MASKRQQTLNQRELQAYQALTDFICDLSTAFSTNKPVMLYKTLIDKTGLGQPEIVRKHIQAFVNFYDENQTFISEARWSELQGHIKYSDRVYIDIPSLIRISDRETKQSIVAHILTIVPIIDPNVDTSDLLSKLTSGGSSSSDNPLGAIFSSLMGGGGTNILQNMFDGSSIKTGGPQDLDSINPDTMAKVMQKILNPQTLSKMMGSVQQAMNNPNGVDFGSLMSTVMDTVKEVQSSVEDVDSEGSSSASSSASEGSSSSSSASSSTSETSRKSNDATTSTTLSGETDSDETSVD